MSQILLISGVESCAVLLTLTTDEQQSDRGKGPMQLPKIQQLDDQIEDQIGLVMVVSYTVLFRFGFWERSSAR
jgi:hypothetical protein